MAFNTQTIRVDLNTGKSIPTVFVHQNDSDRQLTFKLYNNGAACTLTNSTVKFGYVSPIVNGKYTVIVGDNMASGTVNGNTITFLVPKAYTKISGVGLLTMILTTNTATLRPVNIKFVIQKSADGDDTVAMASDIPDRLAEVAEQYYSQYVNQDIEELIGEIYQDRRLIAEVGDLLGTDDEYTGGYVEIPNTTSGKLIDLEFTASNNNLVYCGGRNLFDGTIKNIALGTLDGETVVLEGDSYRGFIVPIKGGLTYTVSRNTKSSDRFRMQVTSEYPAQGVETLGAIRIEDDVLTYTYDLTDKPNAKYLVVYLSATAEDVGGTNYQVEIGSKTDYVQFYGQFIEPRNDTLLSFCANGTTVAWSQNGNISAKILKTVAENVDPKINALRASFPRETIAARPYLMISDTRQGQDVDFSFTASNNNLVYCGGKNLFDGTIRNIALGTSEVIEANNYRGFFVPIKGGQKYTVSRSSKSSSRFRIQVTSEYPAQGVATLGQIHIADDALSYTYDTSDKPNARYLVVYLSATSEDVTGTNFQVEIGDKTDYEEFNGRFIETSDNTVTTECVNNKTYAWCWSGDISASLITLASDNFAKIIDPHPSNTGNFSIVCAKEHSYTDGTSPVVEYFLCEEYGTNRFYITKDFSSFEYAFDATFDTYQYTFGILNNGDVIACKVADALESSEKTDNNRVNPYCWLASEQWETQHEVNFGTSKKPCGWLSSSGFRTIADGSSLFAEYTRPNVATANIWKITGNPTNKSNWSVVKSFEVTSVNNQTGFKHIHLVVQDQYTGIVYASTGDDNDSSMIWYSLDSGNTWTQLGSASEKYCRNLMLTFTENYVYWAPDTQTTASRYLFRTGRTSNGLIDFSNVEDWVFLGEGQGSSSPATYGTAYIPELDCIMIMDRCDGQRSVMPLNIVRLSDGQLIEVAELKPPTSDPAYLGFRTRYTEWYPKNGTIHVGFGFRITGSFDCVNHNRGFGNMGYSNTGEGSYNINNLVLTLSANGSGYYVTFDTKY